RAGSRRGGPSRARAGGWGSTACGRCRTGSGTCCAAATPLGRRRAPPPPRPTTATRSEPSGWSVTKETCMDAPHKLAVLIHKLRAVGCGPVRRAGNEFRCRCPAHDDGDPSLYLRAAGDRILLLCKAECSAEAICDRLDHHTSDLFLDADE